MKKFLGKNFILQTKTAKLLYHEFAEKLPIIDYHCHLPVEQIAQDKKFDNLTQIWLNGDHYKWRAMRTNGVAEKFITGDATDWEKFEKWAATVPFTIRNPLYHWTHLELKSPFGINKVLDPLSAPKIYKETSKMLQSKDFSVKNIMMKMNVEAVCTTDDPIDTLEHHRKIKKDKFAVRVYPAWRPDKAMTIEDPEKYNAYITKLEEASQMSITTYTDLIEALKKRHDFFHENDCRLSDHGLEEFYNEEYTHAKIEAIFKKVRSGKHCNMLEIKQFKTAMLYEFAVMDFEKGWAQQFHVGALRNNNTRMFNSIGPDTGFDCIGDWNIAINMSRFLDKLDNEGKLCKTILYNLNPKDNEVMATMLGNFQDGKIPGKMQWGSGWWFLDQKDGMEKHLNSLSVLGLLSRFIGMLTDSRSFLSYPRHEYFRRILCNILGNDVENGLIPNDIDLLGKIVEDISYNNAKNYFNFPM